MNYTKEQLEIIKSTKQNFSVNAGPGMGKTHTLLGIAQYNNSNTKILCFNKMIQMELLEKIKKLNRNNISALTFHGMAYEYFGRSNLRFNHVENGIIKQHFVNFNFRDFNEPLDFFSMIKILKILKEKKLLEEYDRNDNYIKKLVNYFDEFCKSDLYPKDFKELFYKDFKDDEFKKIFNNDTKAITNYIIFDETAPMFHNFYIKYFQLYLMQGRIRYSTPILLIDEYQDVSKCYQSIIDCINAGKVIKVGDTLQKIYGYNGANGMNGFDYKLSQSFRIGYDNSKLANKIINVLLKTNDFDFIGINKNQKIVEELNTIDKTIIFRTNKELLKRLIYETIKNNQKCSISEGLYKDLNNILNLTSVKENKIYCWYRGIKFTSQEMIKDYANRTDNEILKKTIMFLDLYKEKTYEILYKVRNMTTTNEKQLNTLHLVTAHRCKGMEFENVEIADDFPTIQNLTEMKMKGEPFEDELYVLYVAITRSFGKLKLNNDLYTFYKRWCK